MFRNKNTRERVENSGHFLRDVSRHRTLTDLPDYRREQQKEEGHCRASKINVGHVFGTTLLGKRFQRLKPKQQQKYNTDCSHLMPPKSIGFVGQKPTAECFLIRTVSPTCASAPKSTPSREEPKTSKGLLTRTSWRRPNIQGTRTRHESRINRSDATHLPMWCKHSPLIRAHDVNVTLQKQERLTHEITSATKYSHIAFTARMYAGFEPRSPVCKPSTAFQSRPLTLALCFLFFSVTQTCI